MKLLYSKYLPPKGFSAINIFGFIVIRSEYREILNKYPTLRSQLINHEQIHTAQMRELLYILFYVWYGIEWLILWCRFRFDAKKAYKNISFEKEAYQHDKDLSYLRARKRYAFLR